MKQLAASILSADFGRLAEQVAAAAAAGVDLIHVDVMDGHFVPNIAMGPEVVRAVRAATTLPLDVHLMVKHPERHLEEFAAAGADFLGVHVEAAPHLDRLVRAIRALGAKAVVSLNPTTPLSAVADLLCDLDMINLMTVNPGASGQKLIPAVLPKIRRLRELLDRCPRRVLLEVDGGVHLDTIGPLIEAGVDVFVSGSGIFNGNDITANVRAFRLLFR